MRDRNKSIDSKSAKKVVFVYSKRRERYENFYFNECEKQYDFMALFSYFESEFAL